MATSEEKHELIDDIKFPFKFYRIKIYGHGSDDILYKLDKYGFDFWSRELQKNPCAIIDYIHDARNNDKVKINLPPYAQFLKDYTSRIGIQRGALFSSCDFSVTRVDGEDIASNNIDTIIQGTPVASLKCPVINLDKIHLPKYVLSHSRHEVGDFIETILKIDHRFDIKHLKFSILERAKGDLVVKGVVYKGQELQSNFGYTKDTNQTTNIWKT